MTRSTDIPRIEALAPWITGILFALPVLIVKFPPMADLPLHEASIGLLRHWGDPLFAPRTIYFLNLGHANQLFSLLVLPLAFVVSTAMATKIVVAAALVGLPVAAARFARHLQAPAWTALLVAPLGLGWLFFWGLIQNIVGLVVLLALLPTIDEFATKPTVRRMLGIFGAVVLLHFAHEAMLLVACMALVLFSVGLRLRWREIVIRVLPVAFAGLLVKLENMYAWRLAGPRPLSSLPYTFTSVEYKVLTIPGVLFGGYEKYVRNLMLAMSVLALALFVVDRVRAGRRGAAAAATRSEPAVATESEPAAPPESEVASVPALVPPAEPPTGRGLLAFGRRLGMRFHTYRFEILAFLLFTIFLLAPASIKSTTLVYHRFLPPAWAVACACAGARTRGMRNLAAPVVCAAVPIASLLIAWPTFVDSDRIFTDLVDVMASMQKGTTVLSLNLGPDPSHRLWSPMIAMAYIVAESGGRSMCDYTQSPVSPVAQRPEKQWTEPLERMQNDPLAIRPDWDFTRFRYVLMATPQPGLAAAVRLAFEKDADLIAQKGDWYLYESRLPLVAMDADDAPLPMPHPASLRKKLKEVSAQLKEEMERHNAGGDPASVN